MFLPLEIAAVKVENPQPRVENHATGYDTIYTRKPKPNLRRIAQYFLLECTVQMEESRRKNGICFGCKLEKHIRNFKTSSCIIII